QLPEVQAAAAMRFAIVGKNDNSTNVTGIDPTTFAKVVDLHVTAGDLSALGTDGVAQLDTTNVKRIDGSSGHPQLGDKVVLNFVETGPQTFTVKALFHRSAVSTDTLISTQALDANAPNSLDAFVFVKFKAGVPFEQGRTA